MSHARTRPAAVRRARRSRASSWGVPQSKGASPASPKKLGIYIIPNPTLLPDPLAPVLEGLVPRAERACTSHVFRIGGEGAPSPPPPPPRGGGGASLPP